MNAPDYPTTQTPAGEDLDLTTAAQPAADPETALLGASAATPAVEDSASSDRTSESAELPDSGAAPRPPESAPAEHERSLSDAAAPGPAAVAPAPDAPRTRWAAIIWGLVFLALAGIGFWSTTTLSADFLADIWLRITPVAVGAGLVLIVGAIAVLCALVALARHLQRRSAAHRSRV